MSAHAEVVLTVPDVSIMAVADGEVHKVAAGVLKVISAVSSTGENYIKLVVDTFSYRLSSQPVLKSGATTFILPSEPSLHYVVSFGKAVASDVRAMFEEIVHGAATLRTRGQIVPAASVTSAAPRGSLIPSATLPTASVVSPSASTALGVKRAAAPTPAPEPASAPAEESGYASTIGSYLSSGISIAGKYAAQGVVVGADYAGYGLKWGVERAKEYFPPEPQQAADGTVTASAATGAPTASAGAKAGEVAKPAGSTSVAHAVTGTGTAATVLSRYPPAARASITAPSATGPATLGAASMAASSSRAIATGVAVSGTGIARSSPSPAGATGTGDYAATKTALTAAKWASSAAVTGSTALVVGASAAARTIGGALVDAVAATEYGQRAVAAGDSEAGKAAKQVGVASLHALGEVWDGLERAAVIFGSHTADATRDFVEHRYGGEAADVASQSLDVAADIGITALNMKRLTVAGLVKRTAVEGVKEVIVRGAATGTAAGASASVGGGSSSASPVPVAPKASHVIAAAGTAAVQAATDTAFSRHAPGERPRAALLTAATMGGDTAEFLASLPTVPSGPVKVGVAQSSASASTVPVSAGRAVAPRTLVATAALAGAGGTATMAASGVTTKAHYSSGSGSSAVAQAASRPAQGRPAYPLPGR